MARLKGCMDQVLRALRVLDGRCPSHGVLLNSVWHYHVEDDSTIWVRVRCPRKDCDFQGDIPAHSDVYRAVREGGRIWRS